MNLRPYQQKTIQSLRQSLSNRHKRVIMCAPTGAGKTVMFSFMLQSALKRGKKCMVLTHRTELLTQSNGVLTALNCEVVNLDAKLKKVPQNANMYVAMTQTLSRRLKY
jgi:DNA repair protein RadD